MAYRDNVQRLCDASGMENPIQESQLWIAEMEFFTSGALPQTISATDMNRGARLFLQTIAEFSYNETVPWQKGQRLYLTAVLKAVAKSYFAELGADVGTGKRPLIDAILSSDVVELLMKPEWVS